MKKIGNIILGIWCAITCFVSPIWLAMIYLNVTGLIYQYDYSMDEGTAFILGIILLVIWVLLTLLPNVYFVKTIYISNPKYVIPVAVVMVILIVVCLAMCNWNVVSFLTA